ncbi:MAG: DNA polymerase III subunit alpha, partial [Deltaproteobacteria bacterium]|nr:DNA polymerase III subunit alpha [Deltaproteobacteria bacterium]
KREGRFRSFIHLCESVDLRKVNRRVIEGLIKCGAFDSLAIRRSQAMAVLEQALERGGRVHHEKSSGQSALFNSQEERFQIPDLEEWESKKKLTGEKETLGFYVTGHPLKEFEAELAQRATSDSRLLPELTCEKEVFLGGIVSGLREIRTRSGDRMAFLTLEDLRGTVPVVIFSDLYKRSLPHLKDQEPILVRGQTDIGEESVKVIANEISPLRGIGTTETVCQEFHVRLATARVTKAQLEKLRQLLDRHRGRSSAFIHLNEEARGETILTLPERLRVEPSPELATEVDALFGAPVTQFR